MKNICIIGLGYIGLPTAAILANKGYNVHGVDIVKSTVETVNKGLIHIVEKDLESYVKKAVSTNKLRASTEPSYSDIFIIAVPTPFHDNYIPNLDYIMAATESIAPFIVDGNLIVLESTSPVGTTRKVKNKLEKEGVDTSKIHIAYCPERVLPGNIMIELVENDRIIGGINEDSAKKASLFYETFVQGKIYTTDDKTAEMVKLTENSFRDVNIAFANELSILCDEFDINVWDLISLANKHPRVNILNPGAGVGGHCIAVDPWFIVNASEKNSKLIKMARERNLFKTDWVISKIKEVAEHFKIKNNKIPTIACMGLSFKPNIDDLRESPAIYIVDELIAQNYNIICVEPHIEKNEKLKLVQTNDAIEQADIVVFLVAHDQFKNLIINNKTTLDFCGIF